MKWRVLILTLVAVGTYGAYTLGRLTNGESLIWDDDAADSYECRVTTTSSTNSVRSVPTATNGIPADSLMGQLYSGWWNVEIYGITGGVYSTPETVTVLFDNANGFLGSLSGDASISGSAVIQ